MGKYRTNSRQQGQVKRNQVPPLVRGIGCITMVLVPIVSYALAIFLISGPARSWPIPPDWFGTPNLPAFLFKLQGLAGIAGFLQAQTNLKANLIFAVVFTMVIYGVMSIIYGYVYAMFGPSKYGPQDVPPPRVKTKKYTR